MYTVRVEKKGGGGLGCEIEKCLTVFEKRARRRM
jgi:hypothetical protein